MQTGWVDDMRLLSAFTLRHLGTRFSYVCWEKGSRPVKYWVYGNASPVTKATLILTVNLAVFSVVSARRDLQTRTELSFLKEGVEYERY